MDISWSIPGMGLSSFGPLKVGGSMSVTELIGLRDQEPGGRGGLKCWYDEIMSIYYRIICIYAAWEMARTQINLAKSNNRQKMRRTRSTRTNEQS